MTMVRPRSSRTYPEDRAAAATSRSPAEYPSTVARIAGAPVLTPLKRASMPSPRRMKRKKLSDFLTEALISSGGWLAARVEALAERQQIEDKIRQERWGCG